MAINLTHDRRKTTIPNTEEVADYIETLGKPVERFIGDTLSDAPATLWRETMPERSGDRVQTEHAVLDFVY